eukprot:12933119-Prorocentrum_lima.AAC.1
MDGRSVLQPLSWCRGVGAPGSALQCGGIWRGRVSLSLVGHVRPCRVSGSRLGNRGDDGEMGIAL